MKCELLIVIICKNVIKKVFFYIILYLRVDYEEKYWIKWKIRNSIDIKYNICYIL